MLHLIPRPFRRTLLASSIACCLPLALHAEPLALGASLPGEAGEITLPDAAHDNTKVRILDLRQPAGLLLLFSSNTCPYVTDWMDRYGGLAEWGREHGVGLAVINSNDRKRRTDDSPEAMASLAAEHFPEVPYLVDEGSRLADLLGATRTPEAFLFDGELELVYRGLIDDHSGPIAAAGEHYLNDALAGLLTGGPFPEPTAPVGCAILRPRRRPPAGER